MSARLVRQMVDPTYANPNPDCGERALLRAVLYDAVLCLLGQGVNKRERNRAAAEARRWMESRDRSSVFAFESLCHVLDIDPNYLRDRLLHDGATTDCRPDRVSGGRLRGNDNARGLYRSSADGRGRAGSYGRRSTETSSRD